MRVLYSPSLKYISLSSASTGAIWTHILCNSPYRRGQRTGSLRLWQLESTVSLTRCILQLPFLCTKRIADFSRKSTQRLRYSVASTHNETAGGEGNETSPQQASTRKSPQGIAHPRANVSNCIELLPGSKLLSPRSQWLLADGTRHRNMAM